MNNLTIKEVNFNGAQLMAAQNNETQKIYVGVSWMCKGIGFNKDEKDRQVKNIQSDLVLRKGCVKFDAGAFDPNNETLAIELEYLPLWLAKISITPKMQKEQLELTERLIEYQLKAKDVLAKAFLPEEQSYSELSPEIRAIFVHDKKIQAVEKRVDNLENTMTIDYGQQLALQNIANKTVINFLGGKDSPAYKKIGKKVFKAIWHTYKEYFNVSSYKDTPVTRLTEARQYLSSWIPDYNILLEIKNVNSSIAV